MAEILALLTYSLINNNSEYIVTSCSNPSVCTYTTIPNEYNGLPVTQIGSGAFADCLALKNIEIPNTITIIDSGAFFNCGQLTNILIPENVTIIGGNAFFACTFLKHIVMAGVNPPTISSNTFDGIHNDAKFYCSSLSLNNYKNANIWSNYSDKIIADDLKVSLSLSARAQKSYFANKKELNDYVKNTDIASKDKAGVLYLQSGTFGIGHNKSAGLYITQATEQDINRKTNQYQPITPKVLDYAVKSGLTTNTITLTDEEKANALTWLGASNTKLYQHNIEFMGTYFILAVTKTGADKPFSVKLPQGESNHSIALPILDMGMHELTNIVSCYYSTDAGFNWNSVDFELKNFSDGSHMVVKGINIPSDATDSFTDTITEL